MSQQFFVDDYFHIGHMHLVSGKPCQDYSFSGISGNGAFAVVSDGCSTGRHTDVGARITALSAVNTIKEYLKLKDASFSEIDQLVKHQYMVAVSKSIDSFGLELQDMLATCVYVSLTSSGGTISLMGDGVVAKVYLNGVIKLASYRWANNAPLYPSYIIDEYRSFIDYHGGDINSPALTIEYGLSVNGDKIFGRPAPYYESVSLGNALSGVVDVLPASEVGKLAFVAIFTDGVMQIDGTSWQDAVLELLAFKNFEGEFAKRRMIRFIKDSKKDGKNGPLDDIAYAVIRISSDTVGEN